MSKLFDFYHIAIDFVFINLQQIKFMSYEYLL